jgi:predicted DNA repair protein MutK
LSSGIIVLQGGEDVKLIAMSNVEDPNWLERLGILSLVAIVMTALVYGTVALLVKMDDIGILLSHAYFKSTRKVGVGIVKSMPYVFNALGIIGTIAMLWVGGHIFAKSLHDLNVNFLYELIANFAHLFEKFGAVAHWTADTLASAILGVNLGFILVEGHELVTKITAKGKLGKVEEHK